MAGLSGGTAWIAVKPLTDKKAWLSVGAVAKAGVVAAGIGAVMASKSFLQFDDAMNSSLAIMGEISGPMRKQMEKAAREVGKTTRFSATEAAESYFFLASAGMSAEAAVKAMPAVSRFAAAGNFDLARATDLATDAQSALGLAVKNPTKNLANLTRVTDVFVKANTLANTSVEQISEAMTNKAGAAMRAVGMDIEAGSAVLAAFADQGVKGKDAGTQFSIVLRDLQTRALGNKDAFKAAGISVFDAQGEFRNMGAIVGDLEGHLAGMSDAQKKASLSTLGFSDKSMAALTTLLGTSDAIKGYEKELRNAGGTTDKIAKNQLKSFSARLDILKSRVADVGLTVGGVTIKALFRFGSFLKKNVLPPAERFGRFVKLEVLPVLETMAGQVTGLLVPALKRLGDQFSGSGGGLTDLLRPLGEFAAMLAVNIIPALVGVIDFLIKWQDVLIPVAAGIGAMVLAFKLWTAATKTWTAVTLAAKAVQASFNLVLAMNPIGLVVLALVGLGVALVVAYKKSEKFRAIVDKAFRAVQKAASFAYNWVKQNWPLLLAILTGPIGIAVLLITKNWGKIKAGAAGVKDFVGEKFRQIAGFITSIPGKISALGGQMLSAGKTIMGQLFEGIKRGATAVGGFVSDFASTIAGAIKDAANSALGLPKTIGVGGKLGIPRVEFTIPAFARGGVMKRAGLALVGEEGPELVRMPRGARVFTAQQTRSMASVIGANAIPDRRPTMHSPSFDGVNSRGGANIAEGAVQVNMPATSTPEQAGAAAGGRVLSALSSLGV